MTGAPRSDGVTRCGLCDGAGRALCGDSACKRDSEIVVRYEIKKVSSGADDIRGLEQV